MLSTPFPNPSALLSQSLCTPSSPFLPHLPHTGRSGTNDLGNSTDLRGLPWTWDAILANQFPPDCNGRRFLMYSITASGNFGIFSVVNQLVAALSAALYLNRTLVFGVQGDRTWSFTDRAHCLDRKGNYQPYNCLFQPITNCELSRAGRMRRRYHDEKGKKVLCSAGHGNGRLVHSPPCPPCLIFPISTL